ncbi:HEI10 [Scenedesmus sp. PABB004]|nr:HEI10 [Scenedesmus sp. PABB004]
MSCFVLRCNGCSTPLERKAQGVVTACKHLFCEICAAPAPACAAGGARGPRPTPPLHAGTGCAQTLLESDGVCSICEGVLGKNSMKLVSLLRSTSSTAVVRPHAAPAAPAAPTPARACRTAPPAAPPPSACRAAPPPPPPQLALCGQEPDAIMEVAAAGLAFYTEQQRLVAEYDQSLLARKIDKLQGQCRTKLDAMQKNLIHAKRRHQEIEHAKNAVDADNHELQQKYSQKSMQTRKLQEMVKAVQQENEELKRRLAHATGGRASGGRLAHLGGSGGRGAQQSPFGMGGPAQMITTVRQHKSVIELSPTPGGGGFLGHGSTTVPQHRPGTAGGGFGMFGGGASPGLQLGLGLDQHMPRRPGTSGGMIGGAAARGLANGSGGGALRMGLPRGGMGGLGSPSGHGMLSM